MATDMSFAKNADLAMEAFYEELAEIDPDELDVDLAMGVLSMEFADGTKCIMNRQTAAQQIWLASGATAYHFAQEEEDGPWLDTKGRGDLRQVLREVLYDKLGREISL